MSWLPTVADEQASSEVKDIYQQIRSVWGFLPNYFHALGRDVQLLKDQINLFTNAMFRDSALPRTVKEQIAIVVSGLNTSSYCVAAHMEILNGLGVAKPLARKLAVDYPSAPVEPKLLDLFRFCDKLTRHPADIEKTDIGQLHTVGWSEAEIFEAVLITSLYNCANRFSIGLGLMPDF